MVPTHVEPHAAPPVPQRHRAGRADEAQHAVRPGEGGGGILELCVCVCVCVCYNRVVHVVS